jgi:hypothetical protein
MSCKVGNKIIKPEKENIVIDTANISKSIEKNWNIMEMGYDPVMAKKEIEEQEDNCSDPEKEYYRTALVMFSGGFDSVALAHKVITENNYNSVTLLYEKATVFEDHSNLAENIYQKLLPIAQKHDVDLIFEIVPLNIDWALNPGEDYLDGERDLCLTIHLTTLFSKGQYDSIYLGWNESNVKDLKYSKSLLDLLKSYRQSSHSLYFLEDIFLEEEENCEVVQKASITKRRVVRHLLNCNLFEYCTAEGIPDGISHWYNNSPKWKEVVNALIDLDFDHKDLTKIFKSTYLHTVQKIWNRRYKRKD